MTPDDIATTIELLEEDPQSFMPDRVIKTQAIQGVTGFVERRTGLAVVHDERFVDTLKVYDPTGHSAWVCMDPRVKCHPLSRLAPKHLRRGEVVCLMMWFSDFLPLWAASWHRFRLHGREIVREVHDLDQEPDPARAALSRDLLAAAELHGWEWMPRATRELIMPIPGFGPWNLGHLVLGGSMLGDRHHWK